ncbi:insulin-degrading enzyme [Colletotrichum sp. SAR 10_96]|nr:insulin-degrading enzyme [Colletotrichum sp. SAR 10_96]
MTAPKPAPVELVTKSLEKPLNDKRTYRVIRLSNKLEALLVHDPETDKASAALDVNVGNFSDEEDMPGTAHAVEHLLFIGTKKFPIENEYSQYLAINSGSSNAYTGATSTNYFFDVSAKPAYDQEPSALNPSPFKGALDRFAQFFIKPLFLKSTLDQELRALEKSLSNPKHPFSHFLTGNFEVLKAQPKANRVNIQAKFMEFHEKHYSANRMKLIFDKLKSIADNNFKFKQKTPESRFTSKTNAVMQTPLPREWLLSNSRLRKFDPKLINKGLNCLKPGNDQKEKWYSTKYRHEKIPNDFMAEIKKAASSSTSDRLAELHLPHKNNFIPTNLKVEKKEVKEPAVAPRVIRNDSIVQMWFKKDDTFWVPKANLIISCRNPNIYSTAENAVKARLFTDLVRDALEAYSYDAELAGLLYSVTLNARGLFLDLSNLQIKDERFDIIKERLNQGYNNWGLQQPFHQPVIRSLVLPTGSNYVYKKTLKDPANVNHCIEVLLYVRDKSVRMTQAKTILLNQMTHKPAFNQLQTKEQLGYVVFSRLQSFSTTYSFQFIIQSERTPKYLKSRIKAFLKSFANNLDSMSETDFEGHKRSLIVKCLEKLKNLDQESNRHWAQIASEYYDFKLTYKDAAHIKLLTKADMVEFLQHYIKPSSSTRAKLSVHLHAQAGNSTETKATMDGIKTQESDAASTPKPVLIKDIRSFRANLQATRGARPAKDLSEYEDMDLNL